MTSSLSKVLAYFLNPCNITPQHAPELVLEFKLWVIVLVFWFSFWNWYAFETLSHTSKFWTNGTVLFCFRWSENQRCLPRWQVPTRLLWWRELLRFCGETKASSRSGLQSWVWCPWLRCGWGGELSWVKCKFVSGSSWGLLWLLMCPSGVSFKRIACIELPCLCFSLKNKTAEVTNYLRNEFNPDLISTCTRELNCWSVYWQSRAGAALFQPEDSRRFAVDWPELMRQFDTL